MNNFDNFSIYSCKLLQKYLRRSGPSYVWARSQPAAAKPIPLWLWVLLDQTRHYDGTVKVQSSVAIRKEELQRAVNSSSDDKEKRVRRLIRVKTRLALRSALRQIKPNESAIADVAFLPFVQDGDGIISSVRIQCLAAWQ